ncbi:MAG TPA: translation initiation factor IF-2 [Patescibacteria group bacterium]|nr:translation initiation factor IF-2 [Patescibacteria group bacterium]
MQSRPPVVAIMGHVDHGKTSLLDAIRKTNVAGGEAGGITQHIGAYQIEYNKRTLTFLDTPGHAAFSKMRSRGAKVTDIVILVVAADDGVKPQTIESIQHIQSSGVEYIVAINKIDMPGANIINVKSQLAEHNVFLEGFGGNVSAVEVSAKTKQGINDLLDLILLTADVKDLQADPDGDLKGVVIESGKDAHTGTYATVLVQNGSLVPRQEVFVDGSKERIRLMQDAALKTVPKATPSMPVRVQGFSSIPVIGAIVASTSQIHEMETPSEAVTPAGDKMLKVILKTDVVGSQEALVGSLPATIEIIASGVGEVTESDVLLAQTTGSRILAFNVKVPKSVDELSQTHNVKIKAYKIIYEMLEDIDKVLFVLANPHANEEVLGKAEITAQFDIKGDRIAGCKVTEGEIKRGQNILYKLIRAGEIIATPKIRSLKTGKADIETMKAPGECGLVFRGTVPFKIGDTIECYQLKEV